MIYNATLLRVDPPSPGSAGADVSVRCTLVGLSAEQARLNEIEGWGATSVIYVPLRHAPSPRPVVACVALLRRDADSADTSWNVKQVIQRDGNTRTLDHMQIYVAPAE